MADNGRHGAPLPAPPHKTVTQCWVIVVCGGAGIEAPWRPWEDGGRHGRWVHGLASFYLAKHTSQDATINR